MPDDLGPSANDFVVAGDSSRAWSGRLGRYVTEFEKDKAIRVDSEESLSGLLRLYALPIPKPAADDVRLEAQRRIVRLTGASDFSSCIVKQLNALMRVGEINDKQARGETLTAQEQAEATGLRNLAAMVKAIRAASNAMEPNPPSDYTSDARWPA